MILLFPDLDTLKLALSGGIVAPDVALAPAVLSIDTQGRLYVEPEGTLSRATGKNLDRIGVKGCKRHGSQAKEKVANWLQIVPLAKVPGDPELSSQTPVLFELESADDLPTLVLEMLRLGNDKQSFRWFESECGSRVLLRVLGPPYYTLLRAIGRTASGTKGAVRAYLEPTPRVWVEYGFAHPFGSQIKVPEQQLLLLRSPRHWLVLDESPFEDVYDILQFDLPQAPVGWNDSVAPETIAVPLKLAAGNAADVPELWVLRENAIDQLDAFVRDADAALVQRLTFAVASDADGEKLAVLRTRPSKLPPPVLPFEAAAGFKPFWKLPNLFLPASKRLHPTLRRDAVRRLLADDPDQVVWLRPGAGGAFTPESVPDAAFRPLEDWVEYVIETHQEPLAAWIGATQFDFDSFVCGESSSGPKPKPPELEEEIIAPAKPDRPAPPRLVKLKPAPVPKAELSPAPEAKPPSAWRIRRESLEEQFLAIDGPLDLPERRGLWPQLAEANAGEGSRVEASLAWLNAMWFSREGEAPAEPVGSHSHVAAWFRSEFPTGKLDEREFDRWLNLRKPLLEDLRAAAAGFLWLSEQSPVPAWLPGKLPAVQAFFETHESALPVRAVWLVALRQAELAGRDVLGLARVRDRLLLRLQEEGLRVERDLPTFLRYAGQKDAERLRVARDKSLELHALARKWCAAIPVNAPFIDLLFSFALARLGETAEAKEKLEAARVMVNTSGPADKPHTPAYANAFFLPAFAYRIEQAMQGKLHRGSFPPEIAGKIDEYRKLKAEYAAAAAPAGKAKSSGDNPSNPYWEPLYVIDRLRQESRILEPNELPQPYRSSMSFDDPRQTELLHLTDVTDPAELKLRINRLYKHSLTTKNPKQWRCDLLKQSLPLALRVGEQFALEQLNLVPDALAPAGLAVGNPPTRDEITGLRGELVERALVLAAQCGQTDYVLKLANQFIELIRTEPDDTRLVFLNAAMGPCLRTLKKLGMRDAINRLLTRVQSLVFPSGTITELREKYGAKLDAWSKTLQTLLHLAGGWLMLGQSKRANEILDAARAEILARKMLPNDLTALAQAYIAAVGHGPSEAGIERIKEFFEKVPASTFPNNWTGAKTYSRMHLKLIEEVIHAVTSDEFGLGPAGRRCLDEDEYLVRNRIHADLKHLRDKSGV
ncbi:MAG: hypothetical protein U0791_22960 [Gemmataceae bacterium]